METQCPVSDHGQGKVSEEEDAKQSKFIVTLPRRCLPGSQVFAI